MPKSRLFGGRRSSTDVNVIDSSVQRSSLRRAKTAFIVAELVGWALAAIALAGIIPVALAILAGPVVAVVPAALVFAVVWAWPVLRILLHWMIEITGLAGVLAGSTALAALVGSQVAAVLVVGVIVAVLVVPYSRALVWCVISRHRLRASFAAFIRGNREGTLPFILHAVPTPVGERVWVWLRPGLSLGELTGRTEQLAVSCWAREVTVASASKTYAALVVFDIKRRDSFADQPDSPLWETVTGMLGRLPGRTRTPSVAMAGGDAGAVELADVPADSVSLEAMSKPDKRADRKADTTPGTRSGHTYKPTPTPASEPETPDEDDGAFWA